MSTTPAEGKAKTTRAPAGATIHPDTPASTVTERGQEAAAAAEREAPLAAAGRHVSMLVRDLERENNPTGRRMLRDAMRLQSAILDARLEAEDENEAAAR